MILPFLLILATQGFTKLRKWKFVIFLIVVVNLVMFVSINLVGKTDSQKMLRDIRQEIDSIDPS